jgi:hypothetical protein
LAEGGVVDLFISIQSKRWVTGGPRFKLAEKIGAPCLACLWPDVGSRTLHLSGAVDFAFAFAFVFVFALVFAVSS